MAALEEAANLTAADADRFTETVMHHWRARLSATLGQLEAAETEVGLCWAAGRSGGRRRPATGWASLTPAELEVVRLVSEGLRNDAIARRLFIAPGTVKVHLSHIFGKLGITTRAELAARAASRDRTARRSGE